MVQESPGAWVVRACQVAQLHLCPLADGQLGEESDLCMSKRDRGRERKTGGMSGDYYSYLLLESKTQDGVGPEPRVELNGGKLEGEM